jgi:serine phosphatase RsbU (regulator of sigma subunit)
MGAMPLSSLRPAVELDLAPGDLLAVLSDGIYEYPDGEGRQFGRERVESLLREVHTLPASAISRRLLDEVRAFAGTAPQDDDVTMVFVKRQSG